MEDREDSRRKTMKEEGTETDRHTQEKDIQKSVKLTQTHTQYIHVFNLHAYACYSYIIFTKYVLCTYICNTCITGIQ